MELASKESTIRDYLRVVFRYKTIIIITITIVMSLAFINRALKSQNQHMASVKLMLQGKPETEVVFYKDILQPRSMADIYTGVLKTRTVTERVVKALRLEQRPIDEELQYKSGLQAALAARRISELKAQLAEMGPKQRKDLLFNMAVNRLQAGIRTGYDVKSPSIYTISVLDINPNAAIVIANSLSRSFIIYNLEQQIMELKLKYGDKHSTITQLQYYIDGLYKTLDGKLLPDLEALGPASVKILEQAKTSVQLSGNQLTKLIIAFFAAIFFSILLAFIFDFIDQSFKSPQDIKKFLNIPVISSIPKRKSKDTLLISGNDPAITDYTRSFQHLAENVYLIMKDKNLKSLLITDIEDPKDTYNIIVNLGLYLSDKGGHKVLIIDANLRNPSVSKILKVSSDVGLTDVLEEKIAFEAAIQDMGSNLYILPANETQSNSVTLLASSMMIDILNRGGELYDIVLCTCADLKNFSDAVILSSKVDGTAIVINEGTINRQVVSHLISPLEQSNMIGAILNNRTYVIPEIIYKLS